ncbi:UNVERIFIED_CONTAM: hypothetical protein Slati_1276000 [Sesamum latifolium]|uniref:DUF659 domain-containing protein n=1 Tax=Sesamum latifolium TaxID=2727402 RepID=A0AAW2XGH3_9LAMI
MRWKTEQEQQNIAGCKRNISCSGEGSSAASTMASKKQTQLGPINLYFTKESNEAMQQRKGKEAKVIDEAKKKLRENAVQKICRWMYDAGLPFNAVNYESGQQSKLLDKRIGAYQQHLESMGKDQAKYGCSLMADGWTDRKYRSLINFLVNSPKGIKFIGSVDAPSYSHTGYLLEAKYMHLYWTPCAAHCIDLIGQKQVCKRGSRKTCGEYNIEEFLLEQCSLHIEGSRPLVKVLRLVDGEKKPPMGYIYEAMDRAKEAIAASFSNVEEKYKKKFDIIDARWDIQLHRPLHAAGYYLNPEFYYSNPSVEQDKEVMGGLFKCIERLIPDGDMQDKLIEELAFYKKA